MTTRMLIDARHAEETRVAVVKGNRIEEFDFEAAARKQIKGNIYLAKVTRVEPSLQAAFIEYGGNRHGFLAFSEIHPDYYQIPKEDREALLREEQRLGDHGNGHDEDEERASDEGADAGNDTGEGAEAPTPEEHGGGSDDASAEAMRRRRMALRRRYKIQEVIRRRQVMLVQVVKEERGNKGAALTTYISLAGRYSVLMPNTAHGGGISRKIVSASDRKRLKQIIAELNLPSSMGAIVRTAGLERTRTEIKRDFDYLTRLWDEIREKTMQSAAPALIHEDSDLIKRAIRDIYSRDIDEVLVDGEAGYKQARGFMKLLMPSHARKVKLYADPVPLFHRAGVEGQLAGMMNPVVQLRSGGYIVINPTEALVSIDVNSGRSTREYNIEETAVKTNIEAAEEVARQLRLRDMAGLIVIDFIDMESHGNNRKVERALKDALKNDRARIQVGRISAFGLMEMSRQRLRTGVLEASTHSCPMCDGTGLVRSPSSAALLGLRLLEEEAVKGRCSQFRLRADRDVAIYILNRKRAEITELEDRYGVQIEVVPDEALIGARMQVDSSGPPPLRAPQATALPVLAEPDDEEPVEEIEDEEADTEAEATEERGEREDREDRDERRGRGRGRGRRRRGRGRDEQQVEREVRAKDESEPAEAGPSDVEESSEEEERLDREPRRRRRRRRRGRREGGDVAEAAMEAADAAETVTADVPQDAEGTSAGATADEPAEAQLEAPVAQSAAEAPSGKADEAAATDVPADISQAVDVADAPAEPVKKRRAPSRRRKADAAAAESPAAEAPAAEAPAEAPAEPAPKPKRTRARKPKAAPAETVEAVAVEPAADIAATEAQPLAVTPVEVAPEDAPQAAPDAAREAPAAANDAPAADATPDAPAEPAQPPRRGWWQRTFGA